MAHLNRWQGIGNVGRDPQTRALPSGDEVAMFSIDVTGDGDDRRYYPKVILSNVQLLGARPQDADEGAEEA